MRILLRCDDNGDGFVSIFYNHLTRAGATVDWFARCLCQTVNRMKMLCNMLEYSKKQKKKQNRRRKKNQSFTEFNILCARGSCRLEMCTRIYVIDYAYAFVQ